MASLVPKVVTFIDEAIEELEAGRRPAVAASPSSLDPVRTPGTVAPESSDSLWRSALVPIQPTLGQVASAGPIFVVHGHDDSRQHQLMRLLDRAVRLRAIVLHEQANRGATILEKFERHAMSATFAVVLLTGDDEGRARSSDREPAPRGRQNVIFELGVFIGLLGRSRVVVLKDPAVEEPSDINGLVYIELDKAGAWRYSLLKELAGAGIDVDYGAIP